MPEANYLGIPDSDSLVDNITLLQYNPPPPPSLISKDMEMYPLTYSFFLCTCTSTESMAVVHFKQIMSVQSRLVYLLN